MKKEERKADKQKTSGSAKQKASFDQNGSGASDKFGQAGSTPNEAGEDSIGTTNKQKEK